MDRTLKQHISDLQHQIQRLSHSIMENSLTRAERNRIDAEMRAAKMALEHYCTALEIEKKIGSASQ